MAKYTEALNSTFHALADPTRRAVINKLGHGEATISQLAEPFRITLPTFMKHIRVLEASGLVTSKKIGRVRTCKLNAKKLAAAHNWFEVQHSVWEGQAERVANYVESQLTNKEK